MGDRLSASSPSLRIEGLTDEEFRVRADDTLEALQRSLSALADKEDFEVEFQNGVVDVRFEGPSPARFIVSPNAPVHQIWVSALGRGYKLSWSGAAGAFVLGGEPLAALVERLVRQQLGR
ncbi:MAG: iron donor protein CyaY [Acidobacteriota bacterium]